MNDKPLLLAGGTIVDVAARALRRADVLVRNGVIAAVGPEAGDVPGDAEVLDVAGRIVAPGFMDAHLHIESSLLSPIAFAHAAVRHGTTAVFVDPHEIANVIGRAGIELFLEQARMLPLDMYVGIPSCVPATNLEDAGAEITPADITDLLGDPQVFGLAEMMNFPGIVHGLGTAREKVELACARGKLVDGHAPGLGGPDLLAYVSNGHNDGRVRIMSDHECTTAAEVLEKRRAGMQIALRYGSATKDLARILPGLLEQGFDSDHMMLCSDDLDPVELWQDGHVDRIIRKTRDLLAAAGWEPERAALEAIAMATLHTAQYFAPFFRLHGLPEPGEIVPGKAANLVVLKSLDGLEVERVLHRGQVVVAPGLEPRPPAFDYAPYVHRPELPRPFTAEDFALRHHGPARTAEVKVIGLTDGLETRLRTLSCEVREGEPVAPPGVAKIAVIERHKATGTFTVGFVEQCLTRGAVASTVAHDSHNVIVVGMDDAAMAEAVNHLRAQGPGMVVVGNGVTYLPLPLAGLMATAGIQEVVTGYEAIRAAVRAVGGEPNLIIRISFLALPVIPELRITNRGLVDVNRFDFVELY